MEEWDELANYILADPDEILSSYNQKLWRNCPQGHKYDMSPKQKLYYRMKKKCSLAHTVKVEEGSGIISSNYEKPTGRPAGLFLP